MVSLSRRLALLRAFKGVVACATLGALQLAAPTLILLGTAVVCQAGTSVDDDVGSGVQLELSLEKRLGHLPQFQTPEGFEILAEERLLEVERKGFKTSLTRVEGRLCVLTQKLDIVDMKQDELDGLIAVVAANQKEFSTMLAAIACSVKELHCMAKDINCKLASLECLLQRLSQELCCLAKELCCLSKEVRGAIIWAFVVGIIIGAIGGSFITCGGGIPPAVASVPIW